MRRQSRWLGAVVLAVCSFVLGVWTLGLVVSDRFVWSQYLSWLPSVVVLPVGAVLWVVGAMLARLGRERARAELVPVRARGSGRRRPGSLVGRAAVVMGIWLAAAVVWVGVWELRLYRMPLQSRPVGKHLRVLHWNITAIERNEQITGPLLKEAPDVAVLVNPHSSVSWNQIPAQVGGYQVIMAGGIAGIVIASKAPVVRWGMMHLGLEGLPPRVQAGLERRKIRVDPGRAMFIEIDAKASLGRNVVVWVLDMPSEPRLSRWEMAKAARSAIGGWTGAAMTEGGAVPMEGVGFPAADVVVGDFNITRGAASLSVLLPGMRNAFDEGGAGYAASWPRQGYRTPIPLVHIDQMFVGGDVRAARYEMVDPGFGYHGMQVGDVVTGTYP
jgi:hypothetical protein